MPTITGIEFWTIVATHAPATIGAIGACIASIVAAIRIHKNAKLIEDAKTTTERIERNTNGLNSKLVKAALDEGLTNGHAQGVKDQKAFSGRRDRRRGDRAHPKPPDELMTGG
jgi:hypothetical protein